MKIDPSLKKKYPFIPFKNKDDIYLVLEAENYKSVKWIIVDEDYLNYLKNFLNMVQDKNDPIDWKVYWGLEGRFHIFERRGQQDRYDIWIWVDDEDSLITNYPGNNLIWKDFLSGAQWNEGLAKCLDPNYGGTFDEARKEKAAEIIYG